MYILNDGLNPLDINVFNKIPDIYIKLVFKQQ